MLQYIHWLHSSEWRLTCTETAPSQKSTHFLNFPWQQQTLHTRGARGLQLKQGLSLRETTAEDGLQLSHLSTVSSLSSFFLVYFVGLCVVCLYMTQKHTRIQISFFLSYTHTNIHTHTPTSRITRESVQTLLLSHKAPTVPWSTRLLRYTWHTRTHTHTHTHTHTPTAH